MQDPQSKNDLDRNPEINGFDNGRISENPRLWNDDKIVREEEIEEEPEWDNQDNERWD